MGERDDADNREIADILEAGIAGAEKALIGGAGHVPNLERPQEFDRLVLHFLRGAPAGR